MSELLHQIRATAQVRKSPLSIVRYRVANIMGQLDVRENPWAGMGQVPPNEPVTRSEGDYIMALKRKLALVNLSTGEIEIQEITRELREKYIGGRGLDIYLLYTHLKPGTDPLSPDNVCCISAGILGGTPASASARTVSSR